MKVQPSVKRRCKNCKTIHRRGRVAVICKTTKRHNQRQG